MDTALVRHTQLVAVTPQELAPAQAQVVDWCRAKILSLASELREQRANLDEAKKMLWRNQGWQRAITKTKRVMVYYAKVMAAVRAGYLIVPNFDVDIIAVRVARAAPPYKSGYNSHPPAEPEILPPSRGRYVDDKLRMRDDSYDETKDGKTRHVGVFTAIGYEADVGFPASLVKPSILDATDRAMAHRIFDRIGIVRKSRRSDPIVVGQIIDPREKYWHANPRCVSFFVAWWLDTKDL